MKFGRWSWVLLAAWFGCSSNARTVEQGGAGGKETGGGGAGGQRADAGGSAGSGLGGSGTGGGGGTTIGGTGGHSGAGGGTGGAGGLGGATGLGGTGGFAGASGLGGAAGAPPAIDDPAVAANFAIDAAHTNAQPDGVVATPLMKKWTATFNGTASYPLVAGGNVYVAAAESQPNVRALDVETGALVWGPIAIGSAVTLAYDAGHLYTLDTNGNLAALDPSNGHRLWATQLHGQLDFQSAPVATNGWVYVNGLESGGTTYGIDGATGTTKWTANTFDGSFGTVAVAGGVVYEAEACDQLSAFDALTGKRFWFFSGSCTGGGGNTPGYYNGEIWLRDVALGNLIVDASGHSQGSFAADAPPSFHAGLAFYMRMKTLTAVEVATSTIKWSFLGDGMLCSSASIAGHNGQVFVGSASGNVYELDETTGHQISVDDAGSGVSCGTEERAMAIAAGHLIVPAGDLLVAY